MWPTRPRARSLRPHQSTDRYGRAVLEKLRLAWKYRADIAILLAVIQDRRGEQGRPDAIFKAMNNLGPGELFSTNGHFLEASKWVMAKRDGLIQEHQKVG